MTCSSRVSFFIFPQVTSLSRDLVATHREQFCVFSPWFHYITQTILILFHLSSCLNLYALVSNLQAKLQISRCIALCEIKLPVILIIWKSD